MKREYTDYINDIYDSIKKIEKFTEHMKFAQFEGDDKTILAVVKALEIIGEAVKKIPLPLEINILKFLGRKFLGCETNLSMNISA